jgi:hypothetical protein
MSRVTELVEYLIARGTKLLIGVPGGGDSFEIIQDFLSKGGDFIQTASEFSAPIISSSINKMNVSANYSASISIRGPGLVSSLPGIYHNYLEDLKSISISESLNEVESAESFHKSFGQTNAMISIGFTDTYPFSSAPNFNFEPDLLINQRMLHLSTRDNLFYSYHRSTNEMCSDKSELQNLADKKKIFIIGKRGIENLEVKNLMISGAPYFLTPAALPFANLNSPNYLGVWTGNEQFKFITSVSNLLDKSIFIRLGVMKRELLTLKKSVTHYDFTLDSNTSKLEFAEFIAMHKIYEIIHEKKVLTNFRNKLAFASGKWSVYSAISIINQLDVEFNFAFDVGSFATIIENFLTPSKQNRLHSSFVGKFMGTAIPTSIGISLAERSTPVVCMLGEGSLASSFNDIATISSLRLPICILVFTDNSMHSVVGSKKITSEMAEKFLPSNYHILTKTTIADLPCYRAGTPEKFSSLLNNWKKESPMMIFLEFDSRNYALGVEQLR